MNFLFGLLATPRVPKVESFQPDNKGNILTCSTFKGWKLQLKFGQFHSDHILQWNDSRKELLATLCRMYVTKLIMSTSHFSVQYMTSSWVSSNYGEDVCERVSSKMKVRKFFRQQPQSFVLSTLEWWTGKGQFRESYCRLSEHMARSRRECQRECQKSLYLRIIIDQGIFWLFQGYFSIVQLILFSCTPVSKMPDVSFCFLSRRGQRGTRLAFSVYGKEDPRIWSNKLLSCTTQKLIDGWHAFLNWQRG